jgi:peroxiredoxin
LTESPQPAGKDGRPALPYMELGKLARYAKISTSFSDPMLTKAEETLTADEAEAGKIDFTLKDLNGKKVTLSALRGKIVLIDFWGMECMTCHREMTDLDLIYTHYQSQGLVILSITSENPFNVNKFFTNNAAYHPPVLLDDNGKVGKEFHIDGVPRSFVFDREGKLVAQSIDMCDQHQLYVMLAKAGLHP